MLTQWNAYPHLHNLLMLHKLHTYITGKVGTHNTVILLDSSASCSVLSRTHISPELIQPEHKIRLLNADGWTLLPMGIAQVNVALGDFQTTQTFVIANNPSTPVILG